MVQLVGFTTEIYYDAWPYERQKYVYALGLKLLKHFAWKQDIFCNMPQPFWMTSGRNPRRLALKLIPQRQKNMC